jgi:4-hydroxybenzoate polyprenyltransferase
LFKALIRALRPKQWTKNVIVFAALVFSGQLVDPAQAGKAALAFALFCLLSGSGYLLNDLLDRERDRRHPLKAKRPIASGALPPSTAWVVFFFLAGGSLGMAFFLSVPFGYAALAYFLLQIAYSLWLKAAVILDVFAIAAGFVLRAVAGAEVIAVEISSWLLVCTMLLALFLGLCKRRHELVLLEEEAGGHRASLASYSTLLLDQMIAVVTASTVVAYALYTMADETVQKFQTDGLKYTLPFVLYGIFRYLYLVHQKEEGGNPETTLLTDRPLLVNLAMYALAVGYILYR